MISILTRSCIFSQKRQILFLSIFFSSLSVIQTSFFFVREIIFFSNFITSFKNHLQYQFLKKVQKEHFAEHHLNLKLLTYHYILDFVYKCYLIFLYKKYYFHYHPQNLHIFQIKFNSFRSISFQ